MKPRSMVLRQFNDLVLKVVATWGAMVGLVALAWIIGVVAMRGGAAINFDFFTKLPPPAGSTGGGLSNAIVGTSVICLLATLIGVPLGLFAGVYLAEFGKTSRFAIGVRFAANVLMGTPSILIGIFIYAAIVARTGHYSAYAGAAALAVIILPIVARTTEDMLQLVPDALRESALALGAPRWKVTLSIVFRAARAGLLTGILLAVARVSGESAPLLFTALNNQYPVRSLNEPIANLTVTIFNFAMSADDNWKRMAWGASLLITMAVLGLMIIARFTLRERKI